VGTPRNAAAFRSAAVLFSSRNTLSASAKVASVGIVTCGRDELARHCLRHSVLAAEVFIMQRWNKLDIFLAGFFLTGFFFLIFGWLFLT
jgi:hypothetical protein